MAAHRETPRQRQAFEAWYAADCSAPKIAETFRVNERCIREWAERYGWHARADARDAEAQVKVDRDAITRRVAMLKRHREAAEVAFRRSVQGLAEHKPDSFRDAMGGLKTSIDLERQVDGLPDYVLQILNAGPEELDRIVADLDARRREALGAGAEATGGVLAESNGHR